MSGPTDPEQRRTFLDLLRSGRYTVPQAAAAARVPARQPHIWAHRGDAEVAAALDDFYRNQEADKQVADAQKALVPNPSGMTDDEAMKLRKEGLAVLRHLAKKKKPDKADAVRVAAAKALVDHGERWAARSEAAKLRAGAGGGAAPAKPAEKPAVAEPTVTSPAEPKGDPVARFRALTGGAGQNRGGAG